MNNILLKTYVAFKKKAHERFCEKQLRLAKKFMESKKGSKALIELSKIIKKIPEQDWKVNQYYEDAMLLLGQILIDPRLEQQAFDIFYALNENSEVESFGRFISDLNLASIYYNSENFKLGLMHALNAYDVSKAHPSSSYHLSVLSALAQLFLKLGDLNNAKRFLEEVLEAVPHEHQNISQKIDYLSALIKYDIEFNNYQGAESKCREILGLLKDQTETLEYADYLLNLARILLFNNKEEEALEQADYSKNIYEKMFGPDYEGLQDYYLIAGTIHLGLKNYDIAEELLNKAAAIQKKLYGKASYAYLISYQNLTELYSRTSQRGQEELAMAEYMDAYLEYILKQTEMLEANERKQYIARIYGKHSLIFGILAIREGYSPSILKKCFEFRLKIKFILLHGIKTEDGSDFEKIYNSINEEDAAVEICRLKKVTTQNIEFDMYLFFIITKEHPEGPTLIVIQDTGCFGGEYFSEYSEKIMKKQIDICSFERFWQPIDAFISNKKRILVSADGVYRDINIATLYTDRGTYIAEEQDILLYHDLRSLIAKRGKMVSPSRALLAGNPQYYSDAIPRHLFENSTFLQDLPASEKEVMDISITLQNNGWETDVFIGKQVIKPIFEKLENYSLVHLSLHGDMPKLENLDLRIGEAFDSSLLFLSDFFIPNKDICKSLEDIGCNDDGVLLSIDIIKKDLRKIELLVLSACVSGKVLQYQLGDYFGIQRTFIEAGVKSLLTSLWYIDDEATKEFMTQFYQNLIDSESIENAFAATHKSIRAKYRNPYYWGGFILTMN